MVGLVAAVAAASGQRPPSRTPLRPDGGVTVFIAGDSLASVYAAGERPRAGWGQALGLYLGHGVRVVDEAAPGTSTRTFLAEGRLDRILPAVEPGDVVVVSFGHNDQERDERHTDPATTFRDNLRTFVALTRVAGARPVLVTPVARRRFDSAGRAVPSLGAYPGAMRVVAAETGTPLVDLHAMSLARWDALGPSGTRAEFLWLEPGESAAYPDGVHDGTHLQVAGAVALPRLVARGLERQGVLAPSEVGHLHRAYDASDLVWPPARPADL